MPTIRVWIRMSGRIHPVSSPPDQRQNIHIEWPKVENPISYSSRSV